MTALSVVASQLLIALLLVGSYGIPVGSEHSDRHPKPITRREPKHLSLEPTSASITREQRQTLLSVGSQGAILSQSTAGTGESNGTLTIADIPNTIVTAYCGQEYALGKVNDSECVMDNHSLMVDPDWCIRAGNETGAETNHSTFHLDAKKEYYRPQGCYALPCTESSTGVCYYYNGIGEKPDTNSSEFTGRAVCMRQLWTNAVGLTGTPIAGDGCPPDYSLIIDKETCRGMAGCRSYCKGTQFDVTERNYTRHYIYPEGCFISLEDGCVYFNPPDDNAPSDPVGVPVCNVTTPLRFPAYGSMWS